MRLRPSAGRAARLAAVLAGSLALGLVATAGPAAAAPSVVRVTDAQIATCPTFSASGLCEELTGGGTAAVVDQGAASYLRFETPTSTGHSTVFSNVLNGRNLNAISTLSYQTLIETASTNGSQLAPSINVAINPGEDGATFATLVWEPIYTQVPVVTGQWQTWTPTATATGTGGWWSTRADPLSTGSPNRWGFNSYTASFADVVAALPNATILGVAVNQGSGSPGLRAGVDQFKVNDTTYDFDNPVVANTITQVSGGGQSTAALTAFPQPLKTKLTGRDKTVPVPGSTVTYTVTSNGNPTYPAATFPGNSATATATTGADGVATSPTLTAGLIPGPITVTATSGALSTTFALTVTPPAGPPVADLSLTMTGVPATVVHGASFTATVVVRNNSSFPTTQVKTAVTTPSGLRVTAAPGGIATGSVAAFVAPSLAPGASLTYTVTIAADSGARGAKMITAVTNSDVTDPNLINNLARPTVTVT